MNITDGRNLLSVTDTKLLEAIDEVEGQIADADPELKSVLENSLDLLFEEQSRRQKQDYTHEPGTPL